MDQLPQNPKLTITELQVYQRLYGEADPTGSGRVTGAAALDLFKRTELPRQTLQKIWALADTEARGSLDKTQFYTALRLVAAAQSGKEVSLASLSATRLPLPCLAPATSLPSLPTAGQAVSSQRTIPATERLMYDQLFSQLQPAGGFLSSAAAKEYMLKSGLPVQQLKLVLELADVTQDGQLDVDEFAHAMHLVNEARAGRPLPSLTSRQDMTVKHQTTHGQSQPSSGETTSLWPLPVTEKLHSYQLFDQAAKDANGLVSGDSIKGILQQYGLPVAVLSQIWDLVDFSKSGVLDRDQFALALYLINRAREGCEVPTTLKADLVPPSWRRRLAQSAAVGGGWALRTPLEAPTPLPMSLGENAAYTSSGLGQSVQQATSMAERAGQGATNGVGGVGLLEATLDIIKKEVAELEKREKKLDEEIRTSEKAVEEKAVEVSNLELQLQREQEGLLQATREKNELTASLTLLANKCNAYQQNQTDMKKQYESETTAIGQLQQEIARQQASARQQEDGARKAQDEMADLTRRQAELKQVVEHNYQELDRVAALMKSTQGEVARLKRQMVDEELVIERSRRVLAAEREKLDSTKTVEDVAKYGNEKLDLTELTNAEWINKETNASSSSSHRNSEIYEDPFSHYNIPAVAPFKPQPLHMPEPEQLPPKPYEEMTDEERVGWLLKISELELTPQQKEELELKAALEASLAD